MVKVSIFEREVPLLTPVLIEMSRVPVVGEVIAQVIGDDHVAARGVLVVGVMHLVMGSSEADAEVHVRQFEPGDVLPWYR